MRIAILNAGGQTDYLYGLVTGLSKISAIELDIVDSDKSIGLYDHFSNVNFFNLRGDQDFSSSLTDKVTRIVKYYYRLIRFAAKTNAQIFHVQWENKFKLIDRVFLACFYKLLGKKLIFTAHNIDIQARDGKSSLLNRLSLKFFYYTLDHIIVHTERMKGELINQFSIFEDKISVISHGINNKVQSRGISQKNARLALKIEPNRRVILFFGYIRASKGLDILLESIKLLVKQYPDYLLIVAGCPNKGVDQVDKVKQLVHQYGLIDNVSFYLGFVPDEEVELYFMAADCLALPYKVISQSGVIFLSYRFGLPVIATDVGQLREDIREGFTGFICRSNDPNDLADKFKLYFSSKLYYNLPVNRDKIVNKYSWSKIADETYKIYNNFV